MMTRKNFIGCLAGILLAPRLGLGKENGRAARILLRSSWQTVNIGDVGHTPGVLALIEKYLPGTEVVLYPKNVDNGVREMLKARFPRLAIVETEAEVAKAYASCDFFLHGSGPSLVGYGEMARWHRETGKPFGVYGVTFSETHISADRREVLDAASFLYLRDPESLHVAQRLGLKTPVIDWAPDGAFAVDLRDENAADAFLKANDLEPRKFLCCIARLRNTPYWLTNKKGAVFDAKKHARNDEMKEHDHASLREAIIAVARQSDYKILLCPEDSTQMAVGKEMLLDKLPDDVRKRVVWRKDFWLTNEAVSTYVRSAGLFGNEMHSPIMCIGNGIPAIVCRWAEQTSKGSMWKQIGLGDWLFDLDHELDLPKIVPAVLSLVQNPEAAQKKAAQAREVVLRRQQETMGFLAQALRARATAQTVGLGT